MAYVSQTPVDQAWSSVQGKQLARAGNRLKGDMVIDGSLTVTGDLKQNALTKIDPVPQATFQWPAGRAIKATVNQSGLLYFGKYSGGNGLVACNSPLQANQTPVVPITDTSNTDLSFAYSQTDGVDTAKQLVFKKTPYKTWKFTMQSGSGTTFSTGVGELYALVKKGGVEQFTFKTIGWTGQTPPCTQTYFVDIEEDGYITCQVYSGADNGTAGNARILLTIEAFA